MLPAKAKPKHPSRTRAVLHPHAGQVGHCGPGVARIRDFVTHGLRESIIVSRPDGDVRGAWKIEILSAPVFPIRFRMR